MQHLVWKCTVLLCVQLGHASDQDAQAQWAPHYQYVPGLQHTPLLYGKGQSRALVSGVVSTTTYDLLYDPTVPGGELHLAHAPGEHFALVGGFAFHRYDGTTEARTTYPNGTYTSRFFREQGRWIHGELGAGLYRLFPGNWVGEVYGLLGYGTTWNEWSDGVDMDARQVGVSLQANIGHTSGYFELAFGNRFRFFQLTDIRTSEPITEEDGRAFELVLAGQGPFLVWEPSLTVRGGWRYVRLMFQAGFSGDVLLTMPERADLNIGLGVCLLLPGPVR